MAAFESLGSAVNWVQEHGYKNCNRSVVTHEITSWLHRHLACRKFPCVWVLSDPYMWDALCLWCGDDPGQAATLLRYVVLVPGATDKAQQHRLRFLPRERSAQKVGLRAPNCLSNQVRTCITRRVDRKWAHTGSVVVTPEHPVLLLCEYTWLHLTHPEDILGYSVHLLAPDGWCTLREIAAICAAATPPQVHIHAGSPEQAQTPQIKATADVVAYLEANLAHDELSTLRTMHLVSAASAYQCILQLYGNTEVEERMSAHFESVLEDSGDDDVPPSHLRLRQDGGKRCGVRRQQEGTRPVLFNLSPGPLLDDECPPYRYLLHALRSVYCSPAYRIRHAAANLGTGRLILPFGPWAPLLTVESSKVWFIHQPYNWPLVVGIDRDAALPTIAWRMADGHFDGDAPIYLNPDATALQIELLYHECLHLPTVFDAVHSEYPVADVPIFMLGGFALQSEHSVRYQCLALVLLLLMLSPLATLDEAVSVATLILTTLAGDNRTFSVTDMQDLTQAHTRAWLRYWKTPDEGRNISSLRQADAAGLLHDPRDQWAYQHELLPVPVRSRQPPRGRRRRRVADDAAELRRRAPADDLVRMRHAHRQVQQLGVHKTWCPKVVSSDATKKKHFHRSVCDTQEAIRYRLALKQRAGY